MTEWEGTGVLLDLWRDDRSWVAHKQVGDSELVLYGFGIDPSTLRLLGVNNQAFRRPRRMGAGLTRLFSGRGTS